MVRKRVYLAGLISTVAKETTQWRRRASDVLTAVMDVVSPLRGKDFNSSADGGVTVEPGQGTSKDIILRDYNDIRGCDMILVNLEVYKSERALVGTLMELAWAWEHKIPVVAYAEPGNYLMRNHPFVKEAVAHYCDTMEEAIEFVRRYHV